MRAPAAARAAAAGPALVARHAGNAALGRWLAARAAPTRPALRRAHKDGLFDYTDSYHYGARGNSRGLLYVHSTLQPPAIGSWVWAGGNPKQVGPHQLVPYTPSVPGAADNLCGLLPDMCIATAQIVATAMQPQAQRANLAGLPEPQSLVDPLATPVRFVAPANATVQPGDTILGIPDDPAAAASGDFHAATVVAVDGTDYVTLEGSPHRRSGFWVNESLDNFAGYAKTVVVRAGAQAGNPAETMLADVQALLGADAPAEQELKLLMGIP